jgi:predicted GTPase
MADAAPITDPTIPQVLLFGHVGSGKSSLLAALMRAGETQGDTLYGEVQEASGRLAEIRDAVYRGAKLTRTETELMSYVVRVRPWRRGSADGEARTIILHDCSGEAAETLIRHPSSLRDPDTRAPIARAVIDADAILLLVDATSDDEELQEAFEEFDTFLTVVAQGKASAREVGGFPILLVLTKCDELARPGDTRAKWESRVHDRAERTWKQFDAFLKDADPHDGIPSPFLPFGSVDLSVHAVAIREPRFAAEPPETPYRVAELFRDCFDAARTHRDRVTWSNRRLTWTIRAVAGLVSVMFLAALAVVLFPPARGTPDLAERVRGYRDHEPPPAQRLSDLNLGRNKRTLADYRDDPAFAGLPEELQAFVLDRLQEIDSYQAYRGKLATAMAPGDTRTLEDLQRIEQALDRGELALPTMAWEGTPAAELREKWLADARAIRSAESKFLERYQDFIRRATALMLAASFGGNWRGDVAALSVEGARPPANLTEPLPGSPSLEHPRGRAVTHRVPYEFQRVYEARRDWGFTQSRLMRLRDLADALALTEGPDRPEPALVLPEPGSGVNSSTLPGTRLFALRSIPAESEDFGEWELSNFPDPGRSRLAERLEQSFQTGTRHVQSLLTARTGGNPAAVDTPEGWRKVADALIDPAFADWGRLLHLMQRLRNPAATNPIADLAAFLRASSFELDLRGFDLLIPPDLSLDKVTPSGALTITVTPPGGGATTLQFKQSGAPTREGSATGYRFFPEGGGKLSYRPGGEFRAEVPVRSGAQDMKLVWESGGPKTYQFVRLEREPRLVKSTGTEAATGVKLTPLTGSTVPKLPVLFPEVKK